MADLVFSRGGGANPRGCANLLFGKIFGQNCMKIKEIWIEREACVSSGSFDLPLIFLKDSTPPQSLFLIVLPEPVLKHNKLKHCIVV